MKKLKDGWEIKTLGEIATISSGGTPSRKNESYWNGSIPWVTTAEVKFNTIVDTAEKITDLGLSNSSAKLFPIGTILMAMYGQGKTRGQVAKLGIKATTNQACAAIILKENYHVEFYYQYLMSKYDDIREMSNSGGQENLSANIVKSIAIPVPPLEEQIQIAETLSTWDNAIQTTEKLLENSRQQKKALMQRLLSGENWKEVKLIDIGKVITGNTPPKSDSHNYGNEICWATANDFNYKYIRNTKIKLTKSGANKARIVPKGSILVTCIASIGKNAIADIDLATNQQINSIIVNSNMNNEFIYYLIENNKHKLFSLAGTTAVPIVNKTTFEKMKFMVPALNEQQKIAEILSTADQEIETLQRKLECLKLEKGALMQRLF